LGSDTNAALPGTVELTCVYTLWQFKFHVLTVLINLIIVLGISRAVAGAL